MVCVTNLANDSGGARGSQKQTDAHDRSGTSTTGQDVHFVNRAPTPSSAFASASIGCHTLGRAHRLPPLRLWPLPGGRSRVRPLGSSSPASSTSSPSSPPTAVARNRARPVFWSHTIILRSGRLVILLEKKPPSTRAPPWRPWDPTPRPPQTPPPDSPPPTTRRGGPPSWPSPPGFPPPAWPSPPPGSSPPAARQIWD